MADASLWVSGYQESDFLDCFIFKFHGYDCETVGSDASIDVEYAAVSNALRLNPVSTKQAETTPNSFMSITGISVTEQEMKSMLRKCVPEVGLSYCMYI